MIQNEQLKRVLDRDLVFHDHVIMVNIIPVTSNKVIDYYRVKFSSSTNPRLINIIVETEMATALERALAEFETFYQTCLDNQSLKSRIKSKFKNDIIVHGTENVNVFEIVIKDHSATASVVETMRNVAKSLNVVLYLKQRGNNAD